MMNKNTKKIATNASLSLSTIDTILTYLRDNKGDDDMWKTYVSTELRLLKSRQKTIRSAAVDIEEVLNNAV